MTASGNCSLPISSGGI